ncbi:MAG: Drug resistance transporter EmrB/QacA subfamily [Frankiales bacterium]|nr:Drug resistance transporter EmrB/QacA subfamily [Frankiales bacterium]
MSSTTLAPQATPPVRDRRWLALAVIGVAQLMIVLDASIVNIALPHAQAALHISDANRQWALTSYTLTFGGLLLLGGRVADYMGRKRTFLTGLLGFAAASALGGFAQSAGWLFGARALQGVFAALLAPAVLSLITTTFTEAHERAKAFAVYGAISGTGAAIGLIAGGALTEYLSWRWTLLVNTPIALIVAAASLPLLKESRAEGNRHFDLPGAILATSGLALLVYGFTEASVHGWVSGLTIGLLAVAVTILLTFVAWERRAKNPMLPLRVILDRNRGGSYLAFFLGTLAMFSVFLFLTYYFQGVLGYSALKAGVAFLPFPIGIITSSTIASRTLPRFGPRVLATAGFSLAGLGMLWLTQLPADSSYLLHVVPAMVLISLGMGHVFVPLSSTALLGVPNHDAGAASALVNTMQQMGGSLGVAFLNTIATSSTASYARAHGGISHAAVVHGFTSAFTISVGILVLAALVVVSLIRPERRRDLQSDEPAYDVQSSALATAAA